MLIRDLNDLNVTLVNNLHVIRKLDFDVIVHLPRSGTIPASLLATYLKKPFASVDEFCAGMVNTRKSDFSTLTKILIVDDSIRTGQQMKTAVERVEAERPDAQILTMAVYSTEFKGRIYTPTLFLKEHRDTSYMYPWFMWKTHRIKDCAVDMDGVLCRDCTKEENDDGKNYKNFLVNADLKFKTDFEIGAIVTGRLEKYRPETEAWLKKHGFKYGQLIMGPWSNNEQRKAHNPAVWKAVIYRKLGFKLFIESSEKEAPIIAEKSGRIVWCIDKQRFYKHDK